MQPGAAAGRLDRFQQRHRWIAFPLAVRQKYGDDQGGSLAATVAYYGFFSLFPLLLVFVTGLGYVLHGHPQLERTVVSSTLAQLPVIGPQLRVHALHGNPIALGLGSAGAIWAGSAVMLALQNAFNQVWGVPYTRRPDPIRRRLRSFAMLAGFGAGLLGSSVLSGIGGYGGSAGLALRAGGVVLSLVANFGLFLLAYRVLTATNLAWRGLWPGAAAAAVAWTALQALGGFYISLVLARASNASGTFAMVIGLLSWIYLASHITILGAEANVVAQRRLWPRSLSIISEQPRTPADERALRQVAEIELRRSDETIDVGFDEQGV